MQTKSAINVHKLAALAALIALALLIIIVRVQHDRRRAALEREAHELWRSLGISSWSEVEETDVHLPEVQRLLVIEDELRSKHRNQ